MRAQIIDNVIVAWGNYSEGEGFIDCPTDYSPERYDWVGGEFIIKPELSGIDLEARKRALDEVAKYVFENFTETHRNQFSADIAALSAGYLLGGNRLITWIRTEQGNGVNYTTSGFRTKTYGTEARQQAILSLIEV